MDGRCNGLISWPHYPLKLTLLLLLCLNLLTISCRQTANQHGPELPKSAQLSNTQNDPKRTSDTKHGPELITAAQSNDILTAGSLLEKGADVNYRDQDQRTALYWASMNGHAEMVSLLLEKGADVYAETREGWTAYRRAYTNNHTEVVKLLLRKDIDLVAQQGPPPMVQTEPERTPTSIETTSSTSEPSMELASDEDESDNTTSPPRDHRYHPASYGQPSGTAHGQRQYVNNGRTRDNKVQTKGSPAGSHWVVIRDKKGVERVIETKKEKTEKTIVGPFKTREAAQEAKTKPHRK